MAWVPGKGWNSHTAARKPQPGNCTRPSPVSTAKTRREFEMDRKVFFDRIRPMVSNKRLTREQVSHVEAVLDGLQTRGVTLRQAAYILATAFHESDRFKTLEEYASGRAYEGRADLGNTMKGDGMRFKGRGLVQITGRRNYADWSKRLGVDLVADPELASDLANAVPILIDGMLLGTFTGKRLSLYVDDTKRDYINARRVVNGRNRAKLVAGYALEFFNALDVAGHGAEPSKSTLPNVTAKPRQNAFSALLSALVAFFKTMFRKD